MPLFLAMEAHGVKVAEGLDIQFVGEVPQDLYCGICSKVSLWLPRQCIYLALLQVAQLDGVLMLPVARQCEVE